MLQNNIFQQFLGPNIHVWPPGNFVSPSRNIIWPSQNIDWPFRTIAWHSRNFVWPSQNILWPSGTIVWPSWNVVWWGMLKFFLLQSWLYRGLYTPQYFPYGFHMEWVDSNIIPWTGHGPFFGWKPSHFIFPYPLWNPCGMPMEWCLPYAVHGLVHMDSMEFPVNLYYKSMYYSIWIPWNESIKFHGKAHWMGCQK